MSLSAVVIAQQMSGAAMYELVSALPTAFIYILSLLNISLYAHFHSLLQPHTQYITHRFVWVMGSW